MAWAKCTKCSLTVWWHAGRGCRLSMLKCPKCGSPLKAVSWMKALEGVATYYDLEAGKERPVPSQYISALEKILREEEKTAKE